MHYNYNEVTEEAFVFVSEIYSEIRKTILPMGSFSHQEAHAITDCFLKMYDGLSGKFISECNDVELFILNLYKSSYKEIIDKRIKAIHSYSLTSFESIFSHLISLVNPIEIIQTIDKLIKDKEKNTDEFDFIIGMCHHASELLKALSDYTVWTSEDGYVVKRNSNMEFFLIYPTILDLWDGDFPDISELERMNLAYYKIEEVSCVWPFSNGYARALGKDGRWGFISEEDKKVHWLDKEILYAEDFCCERALLQLNTRDYHYIPKYKYLDLCLNVCNDKLYLEASSYKDGTALVTDEFCQNYHIDVFGNVIEQDVEIYKESKEKELESRKNSSKLLNEAIKRRRGIDISIDYESAIMDSLSGNGADPEIFGF